MRISTIEPLEQRRLLAIATNIGGILLVSGTAKNDVITVQAGKNDPSKTVVTRNGVSETYDFPAMGQIRVEGHRGDDVIRDLIDVSRFIPVTLSGDGGNDTLYAGPNRLTAFGGDGDDVIYGSGQQHDYLIGGPGADYIDSGKGSDQVDGDNFEYLTQIPDSSVSGQGDDTLIGGGGNDRMDGQGGNDVIYGGDGGDVITGGDGNDRIDGGAGKDSITGDAGNDKIAGGDDDDLIFGNGGSDTLDGGNGNDALYGGPDKSDTILGGAGADSAAKDTKDTYDSIETLLS